LQEATTDLIPLLADPDFKDSQSTQKPGSALPTSGMSASISVHPYQQSVPEEPMAQVGISKVSPEGLFPLPALGKNHINLFYRIFQAFFGFKWSPAGPLAIRAAAPYRRDASSRGCRTICKTS
jgi:hypothetical protein